MISNETRLLDLLSGLGLPVLDRRPMSNLPLPFRRTGTGEYAGYSEHDFENDCLGICGHHSASPQRKTSSIEGHARYHLSRWPSAGGIAYTIVIDPDGTINLCWNLNRRLYSQGWGDVADNPETLGDENTRYKGVLIEGNMCGEHNPKGTDEPTPEQMLSLEGVHLAFAALYGMPAVTGHFALGKAACPGRTVTAWIASHNVGKSIVAPPESITDFALDTFDGRQLALEHLGFYSGKIDGIFGAKSKAALVQFQRETGLVPDGIFGSKTRAALTELLDDSKG